MAIGTAVCISTIYLSQPILNLLAEVFHASIRAMGIVTTVTQIGFGVGILFLVPLGDIIPKKRLILAKLVLVSAALVGTGFSANVRAMAVGSLAIGLFATAAQDFLPLAAELSAPERRGRAIGIVMGGLLLGILGSRICSGALAEWTGWRTPFFVAALLALIVASLVWKKVPMVVQSHATTYPDLMRSMVTLVVGRPLIVLSTVGQGFLGLTFSAFWTMLSFHLSEPRFHLSPSQIGAFALAGFAGAAIAPIAGRLADRHGPLFNIRTAVGLVAVSFASMLLFPGSLAALAAAAVVFDLGVQLAMVSHQTVIYSLEPNARSRINAVYVGGLFGFFALGSFGASWAYSSDGWTGVVLLCLASCAMAAVTHGALSRRWRERNEAPI
ncbi:MAG: MFS transporter [Opitutaceae bacterium]|jgi:predicted MFS family arabinose efflux permease